MTQKFVDIDLFPYEQLLTTNEPVAIDTETVGNTRELNIPFYYSWSAKDLEPGAASCLTVEGMRFLKTLCATERPKVFHNAKFDLRVLRYINIEPRGTIHDTTLMHVLLDEHALHALKELSRSLLKRPRIDAYEWTAATKKYALNTDIPQEITHIYAKRDAEDTIDLFYLFLPELEAQELYNLYREEIETMFVYGAIDEQGVGCDIEAIEQTLPEVLNANTEITKEITKSFGETIKLSSPKQLGTMLKKHFPLVVQTEKSDPKDPQWSTDKEILSKFNTDPRMQLILAWKAFDKVRSTLEGYRKREQNGFLYPDYKQITITGRSSCSDPNLQSIPKQRGKLTEVEIGSKQLAELCAKAFRQTRSTFKVYSPFHMLAHDYAQIEYRCFVHYSGSKRLIESLERGEDFHDNTCQLVFGEITSRLRHIIKVVSYGLIYGMGDPLLRDKIRQADPKINSHDVLKKYERMLPEMRDTQQRIRMMGAKRGYVKDVFGRRYRYLHDQPHAIVAHLCQGTAANIKKRSLTRVHKILKESEHESALIMDIHDELVMQMHPIDANMLPAIIQVMEDFPEFAPIPIVVDIAVGTNLLNLEEMNLDEALKTLASEV